MVDPRLEGLREHAPGLVDVLSSSNALLHVPERFMDAAVDDLVRLVDTATGELMGHKEAAEALGVYGPNLHTVPGLPGPRQQLACGSVWNAGQIRALAAERRTHKKRKPKRDT